MPESVAHPIPRPGRVAYVSRGLAGIAVVLWLSLAIGRAAPAHAVGESAAPAPDVTSPSGSQGGKPYTSADYRVIATDGEPLRLREAPGLSAAILARLPAGTVVKVPAGAPTEVDGERWLPVQAADVKGWSAARYLTRVTPLAPLAGQVPSDAPFGQRVAAIAGSALGQPYVWAGNAPGGFDCSGFAQWVYTKAGLSMPRLIPDQLALGTKVDPSALQVGDLVAFKDTYHPGLSHVGIYLGDNRFEHAADEAHGVTIGNLQDAYWKPRFYQAVRLKS
jgi:cell wall-associated NlpC family hydrolase